ncbi:MAG: ATP-binding protein [Paludibacteraceae bacterium]|nr:ATP-binding protein [Paludibacteraceae bacterium]
MDKELLKSVLKDQKNDVLNYQIMVRPTYQVNDDMNYVLVGVRRTGKSYVLYQHIRKLTEQQVSWSEILYLDFEDNRFDTFHSEDFNKLLECHIEMYGQEPHYIFLDEVQNIPSWEKFVRRLADTKHRVFVTGSNAQMLSSDFLTTLGGRYIEKDVYPYDFREYISAKGMTYNALTQYDTKESSLVRKAYNDYLHEGGLPETISLDVKRPYLNSTFQKIYLSDIASRNNISNIPALRLMIKKLAESVRQPISYNRLTNILSTLGEKMSTTTIVSYVSHTEDAWLVLRLRNIAVALSEKESICKYYFVDNGILNLFLLNGETALLENMVALQLFRLFGHDKDNDTVYFYNSNGYEVDFYIPEVQWAIQVCYSLKDIDTRAREIAALSKLSKVLDCKRRTIFTFDEETSFQDDFGTIEVVPTWKWLLGDSKKDK